MYNPIKELRQAERYYNKFIIKQNYERCCEDIQKDNEKTRRDIYEEKKWATIIPPWEEDWQFTYEFNN